MDTPPLLLHVCCAPCAGGCVDRLLKDENRKVVLYYSNSNINTREEFEKRLDSVRLLAELYQLELVVDPYDHEAWLKHVAGLENEPERGVRCPRCFGWSLKRAAEYAASRQMNFATSLTVSPHKNSKVIFDVGSIYPHFEPWDFKKKDGFKRSREIAKENHFYLQNFCGCEFSA
jgi:predicted adenine nucleotide alpha hydrolase (AANH) superfamily ATPase